MLASTSLEAQFNEELSKVNSDRMAVYGHPADDFERVAKLTEVIRPCGDAQLRHVLYAICIKLARLIHTPSHFDSWLDIAGYAKCAIMILERRRLERVRQDSSGQHSERSNNS